MLIFCCEGYHEIGCKVEIEGKELKVRLTNASSNSDNYVLEGANYFVAPVLEKIVSKLNVIGGANKAPAMTINIKKEGMTGLFDRSVTFTIDRKIFSEYCQKQESHHLPDMIKHIVNGERAYCGR